MPSNEDLAREEREMLVLRVPGGNQVDGLPPARHTETVAEPARLGSAENDELMQSFVELARF